MFQDFRNNISIRVPFPGLRNNPCLRSGRLPDLAPDALSHLNVDPVTAEQFLGGDLVASYCGEVQRCATVDVLGVDISTHVHQIQNYTVVYCRLLLRFLFLEAEIISIYK